MVVEDPGAFSLSGSSSSDHIIQPQSHLMTLLELQPSHPISRWKTGGREKSTKECVSQLSGLPLRSFPRRLSGWFLLASHDHLSLQGRLGNVACHLAHGRLCCGPAYLKVPRVWTSACFTKPSSNLCSIEPSYRTQFSGNPALIHLHFVLFIGTIPGACMVGAQPVFAELN